MGRRGGKEGWEGGVVERKRWGGGVGRRGGEEEWGGGVVRRSGEEG